MAEGELTPLESEIERLYVEWDMNRYRNPKKAEEVWSLLNSVVARWCSQNGYSFEDGWDHLHWKLDLRPR